MDEDRKGGVFIVPPGTVPDFMRDDGAFKRLRSTPINMWRFPPLRQRKSLCDRLLDAILGEETPSPPKPSNSQSERKDAAS